MELYVNRLLTLISFDNYSRAKIHHDTSEFYHFIWKGDFIEQVTEQLYDAKADQFLADRFVIGTCPKCGNEEAYGDQCENVVQPWMLRI
jgi:methionyl-tRNA synthetase